MYTSLKPKWTVMFAEGIKRFDNWTQQECLLAYKHGKDRERNVLTFHELQALYDKLVEASRPSAYLSVVEHVAATGDEAREEMPGIISYRPATSSRPEYVHRGDVVLRTRELVCKNTFLKAFEVFDITNTGIISQQQFVDALFGLGVVFNPNELEEIVRESKVDNDGKIHYKEFIDMMMAR